MAFVIITVERDREQAVRETLTGIGLRPCSGSALDGDFAKIACPIDDFDQLDWPSMCPGVVNVQGL